MSAKPKYCHKCKAWHSQTDAGWKTGCVSELSATPCSAAERGAFGDEVTKWIWGKEEYSGQSLADSLIDFLLERGWTPPPND
jgi:hypothetical protein